MTSPWRYADFRWLTFGVTVNGFGSSIAPVALAFAVLDLGGSATDLGLVEASYALANVAAVLIGGVLGDRLPRRLMMQGANLVAALSQGVLAASLIGGWGAIWLLAVLGAINGMMSALAGPSTQAVLPQTVPPELAAQALPIRRLSQNLAMIIGFGVAGLLVAVFGSGWALAIDAVTFLVAAGCFSMLRVPSVRPEGPSEGFFHEAREGLREVLTRTWLWALIAMACVYHLVYGGAQGVLGPIVVGDDFGRPAWGWALAAMMSGFLIGGVVCLRWRPRRLLLVGEFFLLFTALFPLAIALSDSLWPILVGAFLHGFGLEIFDTQWHLAVQENVPPDKLARVFSFDLLGSFISRPVGLALTGWIAAITGYHAWLVVVALVILVAAVAPFGLRDIRRLERQQTAV